MSALSAGHGYLKLGGNIRGTHDASVVLTAGSDPAGHNVQTYPSVSKEGMLIGILRRSKNK